MRQTLAIEKALPIHPSIRSARGRILNGVAQTEISVHRGDSWASGVHLSMSHGSLGGLKNSTLKKGGKMRITIEKNLVEFEPETDSETAMIEDLWKVMVDCAKFNKKLVPVGEYIPQKRNIARFAIED